MPSTPVVVFQYEYQYEVKDPEQNLFFDKNEIGDETGKVRSTRYETSG